MPTQPSPAPRPAHSHDAAIRARLELDPTIRRILRDFHQSDCEEQKRRAQSDPEAYKLSRVFDELRWRYFGGTRKDRDAEGVTYAFCWSTTRNVAGYFLAWREQWTADGNGKRDRYVAFKKRSAAKAQALRSWELNR